jgi:hypothetical protein
MADTIARSPRVSIVLAGVNVRDTLRPWLESIAPQLAGQDADVLLAVTAGDADYARDVANRFGVAQVITIPSGALVPDLWGAAIARATGAIIAVSISACTPAADWIDAIVRAHGAPYVAIGGVIDVATDASLTDRALHLVRYTPYIPPVTAAEVDEIAGDNGTYKRRAFDALFARIECEGFWEAELHRELRVRGDALWVDPAIRVTHAHSYSAAGFSKQRFVHGRHFGRMRRRALRQGSALLRAALAPAVPAVMIARQLQTLSRRGRLDGRMLMAVPLALWFLSCWAWGEAVGLVGG